MNADERRERLNAIADKVVGSAFKVSNTLGVGFLEKVYENALAYELRETGLRVDQQRGITVRYNGVVVGDYVADLVIEDSLLVELKAIKAFDEIHMAQCLNYLRATGLSLCLLLNFGAPRVDIKRIVHNF